MSRIVYRHSKPQRFIVGTVGEPGDRAFFLQVISESSSNCIAIEKSQVQALVERLQLMIRELRRNKLANLDILNQPGIRDEGQLEYPITEDFKAGVIAISYEQGNQNIDLQIQAMSDEDFSELVEEGEEDSEEELSNSYDEDDTDEENEDDDDGIDYGNDENINNDMDDDIDDNDK